MKPFLKWVGGKTQIIDKIMEYVPREIANYHDLFLGGGSTLFAILESDRVITGKIYAYDINEPLIWCYKNIQKLPGDVHVYMSLYANKYKNSNSKKEYYLS